MIATYLLGESEMVKIKRMETNTAESTGLLKTETCRGRQENGS